MKYDSPLISVSIITYNQEKYIGRALDSILCQKEYVFEIFVIDDCSNDNNWKIINQYADKYPDIIKPYRNKKNIGISQNVNNRWSQAINGDICYNLSGDDEVGKDWFKKVTDFIFENQIDFKNELFCIYGNSKCIYPNKDTFTFKNNSVENNIPNFRLYQRGIINSRGVCFSKKILKKIINVEEGRSLIVENAQSCQLHLFQDSSYYLPYCSNIYYANIGVSTNMHHIDFKDYNSTMAYAFNFVKNLGYKIDTKDEKLPELNTAFKILLNKKSLKSFLNFFRLYLICFDYRIGFSDLKLKWIIFSLHRKIFKSKLIKW